MRRPTTLSSLSEAQARYVIIDPALRDAGWNLDDRTQVGFEIPVDGYDAEPWNGVTDYCLYAPGGEPLQGDLTEFEERWTGGYIFENEWQSFRTRQNRKLELTTAPHGYTKPGRHTVAVKVIDIFGNDTMTLVPVSVG